MRKILVLTFLLLSNSFFAQEGDGLTSSQKLVLSDNHEELSLNEWKKLKNFEERLSSAQQANEVKMKRLRSYTRDSIRILEVKLMAVKLLDQKKLLNLDISENPEYYTALLTELRESAIPQNNYLFLEEKMAFINESLLHQKLRQSRWLNIGLVLICLVLVFVLIRFRSRHKNIPLQELSRQEITVRDLILKGKSNKEIANELYISLSTVKTHITNIYGKLNVASRQELFQKSTGTST